MRFKLMLCAAALILSVGASGCAPGYTAQPAETPPAPESNAQNKWQAGTAPATPTAESGLQLNMQPAPPVQLELQPYDGMFFSMDLPKGWTLAAVGEYVNFGFRAYDPANPARQIFFYGNMKYFLKSFEGKNAWRSYLSGGGYGDARAFADAPVLSPATAEQFFYTFGEFAAYAAEYGIVHDFPVFTDLEIVERTPRNSPMASVCLDDSVLRGLFTLGGVPCEGLFAAGVADTMTSYMHDIDAGYYTVYAITGMTAPADEFYLLEDVLARALSSFRFQESYVQQGVAQSQWGTQLALQVGRTLSEAADSYNRAWHGRQRVYDTLSQKRSDATLGYDRLYDAESGQTYRAELGFFDYYDIHREDFANPDLHLVPDDGYDLYGKAVSGYIYK